MCAVGLQGEPQSLVTGRETNQRGEHPSLSPRPGLGGGGCGNIANEFSSLAGKLKINDRKSFFKTRVKQKESVFLRNKVCFRLCQVDPEVMPVLRPLSTRRRGYHLGRPHGLARVPRLEHTRFQVGVGATETMKRACEMQGA